MYTGIRIKRKPHLELGSLVTLLSYIYTYTYYYIYIYIYMVRPEFGSDSYGSRITRARPLELLERFIELSLGDRTINTDISTLDGLVRPPFCPSLLEYRLCAPVAAPWPTSTLTA